MVTAVEAQQELDRRSAQTVTPEAARAELARRETETPVQTVQPGPQDLTQGPTLLSEAGATAEQFTVGLSNLIGVPVDVVNAAFSKLGLPVSEVPFGGSRDIQQGQVAAGTLTQEGGLQPETGPGRAAGAVAREAGAQALPFAGVAAAAPRLAKSAIPLAKEVGSKFLATPGRVVGAEAASAVGAGLGGETARTLAPDNALAEAGGQILGSIGPAAVTGGARALLRGAGGGERATELAAEFAQAGIQPTAADVAERGAVRGVRSVVSKIPGGAGRINKEIQRVSDEFSESVGTLVGSDPLSAERAGRTVRKGLIGEAGFVTRFQQQAGKLYDNLSNKIDDGAQVNVNRSVETLDSLADPVAGAPRTSAVLANDKMTDLREALKADAVTGPDGALTLPFSALKAARTRIGQMLSSNEIISDAPRAELKRIYASITEDMGDAATEAGVRKEFDRASNFWKSGIKRIDDQLQSIANKVNDEDVFIQATKGKEGATRIRAIRKSLTKNEWNTVSKTVLRKFGHLPPGQQDEFGEAFSVERWLTDINKLSPEARDAMFGGTELNAPVRRLQKIASAVKEGQRTGLNVSGTTRGNAEVAIAAALGTSVLAGNPTPALIAGVTALAANRSAALLSSPDFVKWLARSTEISPAQLPGYIGRLSNIGKNDPSLQPAIQEYVNSLSQEEGQE